MNQQYNLKDNFTQKMDNVPLNRLQFHQLEGQTISFKEFYSKKTKIQSKLFGHHLFQQLIKIYRKKKQLTIALKKFHALCIQHRIPQFYSYFFMLHLIESSSEKIQNYLQQEICLLKKNQSHFSKINHFIQIRQPLLIKLHCYLNSPMPRSIFSQLRECVEHYRESTKAVIEQIWKWKVNLSQMSPEVEHIQFIYRNENYLFKILNDGEFLQNTQLAKNFSTFKNDPFFLKPFSTPFQSEFCSIFSVDQHKKNQYQIVTQFLAEEVAASIMIKFRSKGSKIQEISKIYNFNTADKIKSENIKKKVYYTTAIQQKRETELEQKDGIMKRIRKGFSMAQIASSNQRISLPNLNKKVISPSKKTFPMQNNLDNKDKVNNQNRYLNNNQNSNQDKQVGDDKRNYSSALVNRKQLNVMANMQQKDFKRNQFYDQISGNKKEILEKNKFYRIEKLQRIIQHIDACSPNKISNRIIRSSKDNFQSDQKPTLLQRNQQAMTGLRKNIINQIGCANHQRFHQKDNKQIKSRIPKQTNEKFEQTYRKLPKNGKSFSLDDKNTANKFDSEKKIKFQDHLKTKQSINVKKYDPVHENQQQSQHEQQKQDEDQTIRREANFNAICQRGKYKKLKKQQLEELMKTVIKNKRQKLIPISKQKEAAKKAIEISPNIRNTKQLKQKSKQHNDQERKLQNLKIILATKLAYQRQAQENNRKLRLAEQKIANDEPTFIRSPMYSHCDQKTQSKIQTFNQSLSVSNFRITNQMKQKNILKQNKKLREQFQLELFAPENPKKYQPIQNIIKQQEQKTKYLNEKLQFKQKSKSDLFFQNINSNLKINYKQSLKVNQAKDQLMKETDKQSYIQTLQPNLAHKNINKQYDTIKENQNDKVHRLKLQMSQAQYAVYMKKKKSLQVKRNLLNAKKILPQQKDSQFQMVKFQSQEKRKSASKNQKSQSSGHLSIKQQHKKKYRSEKVKPSVEHSNKSKQKKTNKKFITQDSESENYKVNNLSAIKIKPNEKKVQKQDSSPKQAAEYPKKSLVKVKNIEADNLGQLIGDYFNSLPKLIKKVNPIKKKQLIQLLSISKCPNILEYIQKGQSLGILMLTVNQGKSKIRSLQILHIGPYDQKDLLKILKEGLSYVFENDPCDEISMSLIYDESQQAQKEFIKLFQKQFYSVGAIFQKKISENVFERKHIMRRLIGERSKRKDNYSFSGQLALTLKLLASQQDLSVSQNLIDPSSFFSTYGLASCFIAYQQEATRLKQLQEKEKVNQIKHFINQCINLQIENKRFPKLNHSVFQTPSELNQKLAEINETLLECDPSQKKLKIKCQLTQFKQDIQPACGVCSQKNISFGIEGSGAQYLANFLRYIPTKGKKIFNLKSNIYNSNLVVVPCLNPKYKLFLAEATQFDKVRDSLSLDMYLKLFFTNVSDHQMTAYESIWVPQFGVEGRYMWNEAHVFDLDGELREKVQLKYSSYIQNSIRFEITHRDLFISPPFLFGILCVEIDQALEGYPLYARRIDKENIGSLRILKQSSSASS